MNAFDYFFENTSKLEKPFLVGKEEISFKQLYADCLNLASWLENEVGRDKNIMLISVNNLFFIKTYLAIIKSGNICIPLDPSIEKENFKYIADLTKPSLIFLTSEIEKKLPLSGIRFITPDSLPDYMVGKSPTTGKTSILAESCAEIIFTSGSTGKPKGVMISHKNLIANTGSIVEYLN
jgi:long-subunit acyl-CoA synthetase (AMP-forming)